jgi:hypothetical protein
MAPLKLYKKTCEPNRELINMNIFLTFKISYLLILKLYE